MGIYRPTEVYDMNRDKLNRFHPRKDGFRTTQAVQLKESRKPDFPTFLTEIFQTSKHKRKRVPLLELQKELFRRGWHP